MWKDGGRWHYWVDVGVCFRCKSSALSWLQCFFCPRLNRSVLVIMLWLSLYVRFRTSSTVLPLYGYHGQVANLAAVCHPAHVPRVQVSGTGN